jgi:hypothetical protein
MIRYALACTHGHEFEAWFGSSADYDEQAARGLVECPMCGVKTISKQIMAPAVAGTKAQASISDGPPAVVREMMHAALGEVRRHVEDNFDYVGDSFAREARAIHAGTSEDRGIYGEATPAEVRALNADGVRVAPLPPKPPEKREIN